MIKTAQILALSVLSYLAYSSIIFVNFSYDDIPLIIENQYLKSLSGVRDLLQTGRPVRAVSFWLDYQIWGLDARGFHFTNILLNLLCVLSAFYLVKIIFRNQRLAFLAALFWALNPIRSEAVVNVAHRKELFCFLFLALSLIAFKKSRGRWAWLGMSYIFYLLALFSKQVALALPALIFLEEYIFARPDRKGLKRLGLTVLAYLAAPVLGFIFSLSDFKLFSRFQPADLFGASYVSILATQFKYFPKYLQMAFFPSHLNIDHPIEYARSWFEAGSFSGILIFLAGLAILILLTVRRMPAGWAWGWLLLNLLPVLNFIPSNQIFSERYLYIPSLGAALLLGLGFEKFGKTLSRYLDSARIRAALFIAANFLLLSFYFAYAVYGFLYAYYPEFRSSLPRVGMGSGAEFMLGAAVTALPFSLLFWLWNRSREGKRVGLGRELVGFALVVALGFLSALFVINFWHYQRWTFPVSDFVSHDQAYLSWLQNRAGAGSRHFTLITRHFSFATRASETFYFIVFVLLAWGILIGLINRWGRKLAEQSSELFGVTLFAPILLAIMLTQTQVRVGEWGSEGSIWKATLRENPRSFLAWNNLGRTYVGRNKLSGAMDCFAVAHSLQPYQIDPILNLGNTMLKKGDLDAAEHYYRWALKLNPFSFAARLNLSNCLASKKEYHLALEQYLEALRINPDSFEVSYNLAVCYLELGDKNRAWMYLVKTLRLAPNHQPSRDLLRSLSQGQPSRQ